MPSEEKLAEFLKQVEELARKLLNIDRGELVWVTLTYPEAQIDVDKLEVT